MVWIVVTNTDLGNMGGESIFVEKNEEVQCRRRYLFNWNGAVITHQPNIDTIMCATV